VSGAATATFVYEGDGNRVKGTVGGVTITYIGNYYEWSGSTATSYYYAGSVRVAMRQGSTPSYLFADQLGSTSVVANSSGSKTAEVRYKAWGEVRRVRSTFERTHSLRRRMIFVIDSWHTRIPALLSRRQYLFLYRCHLRSPAHFDR
jgi:hypothetical protein